MSVYDLSGSGSGCISIEEEMSGRLTIFVLHFESISRDQGVHKTVISLSHKSIWDSSRVSTLSLSIVEAWSKVFELLTLELDVGLIIRIRVVQLSKSPVVMEVAGESAIGMSIVWHWSTNVWLWILLI